MADRYIFGAVSAPAAGENVRIQLAAADLALMSGFKRGAAYVAIDNADGLATVGVVALDLDCSGALQINSSGGAISIGNDAISQNINIGTGAAARLITLGNDTLATTLRIKSGTGGMTLSDAVSNLFLDGAGALTETTLVSADITPSTTLTLRGGGISQFGDATGYFNFDGAGALTTSGITTVALDCSGTLQINSSGGTLGIGNVANNFGLNLGTLGVRTIAIGSAAATAVNIDAITFSLDATAASNITVTGAFDLNFGAHGGTIALNAAAPDNALVGFTATSIIGALNELAAEDYTDPLTVVNAAVYAVLATDVVLFVTYTDTGVCTLTIPSAEIAKVGRKWIIKDAGLNATVFNIVIETQGAETIEEQANAVIDVDGTSLTLHSDGSNLYVT